MRCPKLRSACVVRPIIVKVSEISPPEPKPVRKRMMDKGMNSVWPTEARLPSTHIARHMYRTRRHDTCDEMKLNNTVVAAMPNIS